MTKRFIYHYHAQVLSPESQHTHSIEGIVTREEQIEGIDEYMELKKGIMDEYMELKKGIVEDMEPKTIIITSLSFLGMTEAENDSAPRNDDGSVEQKNDI